MSDVKWTIKGFEFLHCNCAYGCPCQFNVLPTHDSSAEVGRGWSTASGPVPLNLQDTHAHFASLHMTQSGVVG